MLLQPRDLEQTGSTRSLDSSHDIQIHAEVWLAVKNSMKCNIQLANYVSVYKVTLLADRETVVRQDRLP